MNNNQYVQGFIFILLLVSSVFLVFYAFPIFLIKYLFDLAIYHSIQPINNICLLYGLIAHAFIFCVDREMIKELKMSFLYKFMIAFVGKLSLDVICGEGYENFKTFILNSVEENKKKINLKMKGEEFIKEVEEEEDKKE